MLERKDRVILRELQRDSRLTMQQLADKVGMSSSACWRRVRSLEEAGVIDRYAAILDTKKAGFSLVVNDVGDTWRATNKNTSRISSKR